MKTLNVYREVSGEKTKIYTAQYHDSCENFRVIQNILLEQREKDILELGFCASCDLGSIRSLHCHQGIWRSWMIENVQEEKDIWKEIEFTDIKTDEKSKVKLAFEIYSQGYVIKVMTDHGGLFGNGGTFYLRRIGKRSASANSLSEALKFRRLSDFRTYLIKHKHQMKNLAEKGWKFDLDYHNSIFMEEVMERKRKMKPEALEKDQELMDDIMLLLSQINEESPEEPEDTEPLPESLGDDPDAAIQKEIMYRMHSLELYAPVISDFREKEKIYMSEFFGIIYDLNEEAKKAVDTVRKMGHHPYHVIRSHFKFGETYDVLYVSDDISEWPYERISPKGLLDIWSIGEFSEHGQIRVRKTNGGLQRVA